MKEKWWTQSKFQINTLRILAYYTYAYIILTKDIMQYLKGNSSCRKDLAWP
jgi:hypothetical protein